MFSMLVSNDAEWLHFHSPHLRTASVQPRVKLCFLIACHRAHLQIVNGAINVMEVHK